MSVTRVKPKSVTLESFQWTGLNTRDLVLWVAPNLGEYELPSGWWMRQLSDLSFLLVIRSPVSSAEMEVAPGDWIVKTIVGDLQVHNKKAFESAYKVVA